MKHQEQGLAVRYSTRKQTNSWINNKLRKITLVTVSHLPWAMVVWMALSHIPPRKPPKCPQQSMLPSKFEGVKIKMNMMIMKAVQQIWHLMTGPNRSSPYQLMMIYPMMTPMMPQRAVDAPTLTPQSLIMANLNTFPAIPDTTYTINVLTIPKEYSTLDRNMKVTSRLPKMCMKLACRNIAESRRQTCPVRTKGQQLPPQSIAVASFIQRRLEEAVSRPLLSQKMKRAMSARITRKVKERNQKVGHRPKTSMSQQCSSRGFLRLLLPDTKRTLCSSANFSCSSRASPWNPWGRILKLLSQS